MNSIKRDLIEYYGIDKFKYKDIPNFKQVNQDYMFCVPIKKPKIEQITKIWVDSKIIEYQIIKTPKGHSLEGQKITGYKLLVCGDLNLKIQYVACEPSQGVHTAHATIPFCDYVVLPENINPNVLINPSVLIEDVFSDQIDCKCVYNNITMLIVADVC